MSLALEFVGTTDGPGSAPFFGDPDLAVGEGHVDRPGLGLGTPQARLLPDHHVAGLIARLARHLDADRVGKHRGRRDLRRTRGHQG